MANKFFTAIALLGTCFYGMTWAGTVAVGFLYESTVTQGQYLGSTCFAQNDQKKPSVDASTYDASKTKKETKKPKTLTPEKSGPEETKPMQPFVPSETIPADQGVDFPYDI